MNAQAIVSITDVKRFLKIDIADTSNDYVLEHWVDIISGLIEEYVGGPVRLQTFTDEILSGCGHSHLYLKNVPVYSLKTPDVSDVQYRNDPISSWQDIITDGNINRILIDPSNPYMLQLYGYTFPIGTMNVKVSYKAGYATLMQATTEQLSAVATTETSWTLRAMNGDITPGSFSVTVKNVFVGGFYVDVTATDNGAGVLSGTNVTAGTINYTTGVISLTISGTTLAGQGIYATYTYKAVPGPFIQVCLEAVAEMFLKSGFKNSRLGISSTTMTPGGGVTQSTTFYSLSKEHRALLAPYVRRYA